MSGAHARLVMQRNGAGRRRRAADRLAHSARCRILAARQPAYRAAGPRSWHPRTGHSADALYRSLPFPASCHPGFAGVSRRSALAGKLLILCSLLFGGPALRPSPSTRGESCRAAPRDARGSRPTGSRSLPHSRHRYCRGRCRLLLWRATYCLRQRARAGPGLLVHAAVSVSPFFDNDTFPPGHVMDATLSPCLQERLQPSSSHLSCLTT
jgi:hypothetical protein